MKAVTILASIACASALPLVCGCSSITRGSPVSGTVIKVKLDMSDYEVGRTTQGESWRTSILGGLVEVVDGDKYRVLGINFFQSQYAFQPKDLTWQELFAAGALGVAAVLVYEVFKPVSIEDRAYYKALAAAPDADVVAAKAWVTTRGRGIPMLYSTKRVAFQGKALKFKPHN